MTSNRKRVLLFVIKSIFLIFHADDFTKSFLANFPFCRYPLLFLFYPFGFQYFVVLLSFAELSYFTTAATATPRPSTVSASIAYQPRSPTPPRHNNRLFLVPKLLFPLPFGQFFVLNTAALSSLRSILPCHYSLFRRQYEPLYVSVREVLLSYALIQPMLDRFPHFVSYPPTHFFFCYCTIWLIKVIPTPSFYTSSLPPIASHYQPIRNFLTF